MTKHENDNHFLNGLLSEKNFIFLTCEKQNFVQNVKKVYVHFKFLNSL